jgi:hypothetical protein
MKRIYRVPVGVRVCRCGIEAPQWIESTKESVFTDKDRLKDRNFILKCIQIFRPETSLEGIDNVSFYWFFSKDSEWPIFAVGKHHIR